MARIKIDNETYKAHPKVAALLHAVSEERDELTNKLNPTEAIFGFCAWLTTRDEQTIMSAKDDSACVVELIEEFCKVNELPDVSEQWAHNLIHPSTR